MKKTLIATAVSTLFLSGALSATQLYVDEVNSFDIGGYLAVGLKGGAGQPQAQVEEDSPRVNVEATHALDNGFKTEAKGEWAVNTMKGGQYAFVTRLGYVGLSHDKYGRAVIGTQYTPFSDVIGVADDPIWFATDSAYDNQGNLGTMRGDKMISYRNGVKFSDDFMLNFGLGWQGQHEYDNKAYSSLYPFNSDLAYHYRTQGAISATFMGVTLGIARTQGDVEIWADDIINRPVTLDVVATENAQSNALSVKYGQYGKGFYGAIVYEKNEYMNNLIDESGSGFPTPDDDGLILDKSTIAEAIIAYALPNSLNVSLNYENLKDKKSGKSMQSESALQVEYNIMPSVTVFTGYQLDLRGYSYQNGTNDMPIWSKIRKNNQYVLGAKVGF